MKTVQTYPLASYSGPQTVYVPVGSVLLEVSDGGGQPQLAVLADTIGGGVSQPVELYAVYPHSALPEGMPLMPLGSWQPQGGGVRVFFFTPGVSLHR